MSQKTAAALFARGFDSSTIDRLLSAGYTVSKLKQCSDTQLTALGISGELVAILRAEKRPPIPDDIVVKLLHESKRTCCVCRDPGRPIIIHHIREWTSSHDHSQENLAVLCLDDHDLAHTTKSLSITLNGDQIRDHKAKWLELVRTQDAKAVLGQANLDGARWDFFNHHRLFELAIAMRVKLQTLRCFRELRRYGMLNETGLIASPATWTVGTPFFRLYDVYEGLYLYFYVKDVFNMVLASLPVVDLSNHWSRTNIQALLAPGKWITLQSAFYFKAMHKNHGGRNQRRRALRRRRGIEVTFEFDAWDSTSSSSQNCHLRGHQTAVAVLQVRNIEHKARGVHISCSCLAIGSGFAEGRVKLGDRPPPSHWQQWQVFEEDDAELDTFD